MKFASTILAVAGCLALAVPMTATSADAYVVRKSVHVHTGPYGHGCKTVRTVRRGPNGKSVTVRKVCG